MRCWEKSAGQDSVVKLGSCLRLILPTVARVPAQEPGFRPPCNVVIVPALLRA
jgi:hypothetical protein